MSELEALLNEEIPLTNAIGIKVLAEQQGMLSLSAPLSNNINHKATAFGGSLYCVAVLTGWGLVHQLLKRHQSSGHIVIQQSHCDYLLPVDGEIISHCRFDSEAQHQRFIRTYQRRGKARIKLTVEIQHHNHIAMRFTGHYVVHQ